MRDLSSVLAIRLVTGRFAKSFACLSMCLILSITPSWSQQVPKEILGKWIDREVNDGVAVSYTIFIHQGKLVIDQDNGGEGTRCTVSVTDVRALSTTPTSTKFILTVAGSATCQTEENPIERSDVAFVYSKSKKTEILIIAYLGAGWLLQLHR